MCTPQRDLFGRAVPLDHELSAALQRRVADERAMLERVEEGRLDFFSFDIHFAHVMAAGGFDVVAGNPPWVRNSRIEGRTKRMLSDRYALFRGRRDRTSFHQPDLSLAFFDRSLGLVAPNGVVALLMPAKILNAGYAAPLRRAVLDRVVTVDDWSDDPRRRGWFDADTFPLGIVVKKGAVSDRVALTASGESFELPRHRLVAGTSEWSLVPPAVAAILHRLREQHETFESRLGRRPFMGVKTGDNHSFFLEGASLRSCSLVTAEGVRVPLTAVCRCVRGRDLQRWSASASEWMLWPPAGGWPKPPRWVEQFAATRELEVADLHLAFVRAEHVGIKVAWKDLSRGVAAAVLPDVVHVDGQAFPLIPNQTLYAIDTASLDEAYAIAAVLNSSVAGALLIAVAERAKDAHYRYFGRTVAALPWPDLRPDGDRLSRLSRRAHVGANVMRQIDEVVAGAYGVTADERAVLSAFLERRLGRG